MFETIGRDVAIKNANAQAATKKGQNAAWFAIIALLVAHGLCLTGLLTTPLDVPRYLAMLSAMPLALVFPFTLSVAHSYLQALAATNLRVGSEPVLSEAYDLGRREEDQLKWTRTRSAVEDIWRSERKRAVCALRKLSLHACVFGLVSSLGLMCCAVLWRANRGDWLTNNALSEQLMAPILSATTTAFLLGFARILLRTSGGDLTSRTFAWATRSLIMAALASAGLSMALQLNDARYQLLAGVVSGFAGDRALTLLLAKSSELFNLSRPSPQDRSPLLDVEGMTDEHVERLKEEGILSVHDLAFVPTARLFFSTAYSLQQICNWQDRSLLLVYLGREGDMTKRCGSA